MEGEPTSLGKISAFTILAPLAWGSTYVTITQLLPAGRPLLIALMRVVPAGLVLLGVGSLRFRWRPHGAEWWQTTLLALFNFGLFFPLLAAAVYRLPGGVAAAFGGLQPLFVASLSWLISKKRPRSFTLLVSCVAAVGVSMVVLRPGAHFDVVGI